MGYIVGLFVYKTCHSDKDPLWQHSSGDSLFGRGVDRKMATLGRMCVCTACVPVMEEDDVDEDLPHSMC